MKRYVRALCCCRYCAPSGPTAVFPDAWPLNLDDKRALKVTVALLLPRIALGFFNVRLCVRVSVRPCYLKAPPVCREACAWRRYVGSVLMLGCSPGVPRPLVGPRTIGDAPRLGAVMAPIKVTVTL